MSLSHGKSPWTIVEHDGRQWMVRENGGAWWMVRLPEREVFLLEPQNVPAWAKGVPAQLQQELSL